MQKTKKVQVGLFEKMTTDQLLLMILAEVQFELFEKLMGAAMTIVSGNSEGLSVSGDNSAD